MHDETDRTRDAASSSSQRATEPRAFTIDVTQAASRAEASARSRLLGGPTADGSASLLADARSAAERGERVAILAPASSFTAARAEMRAIARGRLSMVAHALSGNGGEELAGLLDLGWGVLASGSPEDSFDLAVIARRASEDSGVPFVVVHPLASAESAAGRMFAMSSFPVAEDVESFVGPASRVRPRHDPAHPSLAPVSDRGFGERLPFALGAAMREYGAVSGRVHDAAIRHARADHALVLVGSGAVGDALVAAAPSLRELGFDVAAVNVSAFRPFPGARLVKMLSRALSVAVLEAGDEPISHAGPLVREVKSAFTDALTWVPGFPGIGRVPKLVTGVTGDRFGLEELAAVCETMLASETGKRTFSFVDHEHALPRGPGAPRHARDASVRFLLDEPAHAEPVVTLVSAALAGAVGLRAEARVSARGGAAVVDVHASRDHARGAMLRRPAALVLASERAAAAADVIGRAAPTALLGVTSATGQSVELSEEARAVVRERRARVLPLGVGDAASSPWGIAGACAGATVAVVARAHKVDVEPDVLARIVSESASSSGGAVDVASDRARRAYLATVEALSAAEKDARSTKS